MSQEQTHTSWKRKSIKEVNTRIMMMQVQKDSLRRRRRRSNDARLEEEDASSFILRYSLRVSFDANIISSSSSFQAEQNTKDAKVSLTCFTEAAKHNFFLTFIRFSFHFCWQLHSSSFNDETCKRVSTSWESGVIPGDHNTYIFFSVSRLQSFQVTETRNLQSRFFKTFSWVEALIRSRDEVDVQMRHQILDKWILLFLRY